MFVADREGERNKKNSRDTQSMKIEHLPVEIFLESFALFSLEEIINLGSLTIEYGTIAQLNGIRPQHFPILEILHISAGKYWLSFENMLNYFNRNFLPYL